LFLPTPVKFSYCMECG